MSDADLRRSQGARLRRAREQAGYRSARDAALSNVWPESTYRAHETGDRTIGQDDAERYARRFRMAGVRISGQEILFGKPPEAVGDLMPGKFRLAPLGGEVAAGMMLEVDVFDDDTPAMISAPIDPVYPFARQTAYNVRGDSMNKLRPRPILEGDVIICADWEDLGLELTDGMVVVVQRSIAEGQYRERSVKQVELYPEKVLLHPRSSNHSHTSIVVPRRKSNEVFEEVKVLSLLRYIYASAPVPFS